MYKLKWNNGIYTWEPKEKYASLGYHFFVDRGGTVFEGRPIELMGSHAGRGKEKGVLNDPDWGSVGIVLQGDYHDNYYVGPDSGTPPKAQMETLEKLIMAIARIYSIDTLILHREVKGRKGDPTVCPGDILAPLLIDLRKKLKMNGP